jgi:hypothetical protein
MTSQILTIAQDAALKKQFYQRVASVKGSPYDIHRMLRLANPERRHLADGRHDKGYPKQ